MNACEIIHSGSGVIFLRDPRVNLDPGPKMFDRMSQVLHDSGAGLVYSDAVGHPHIDYQAGSIRDNFDFGAVVAVREDLFQLSPGHPWSALYDLRLRITEKWPIVRIPEALYAASLVDVRPTGQKQFDYVDPKNRTFQIEMERIATEHLKRIGAYLEPAFQAVPMPPDKFPVRASVVIPIRNRERTILDAVKSALGQKTDFPFNIIVVDNHSTDRTTELLRAVADSRLIHLIPE